MDKYEFTSDMGEISGFGGRYEACCRAMLKAGCEWFDEHPDADPQFHGYHGVYGILAEDNADAKALSAAICAPGETGGGVTGAMHQACVSHCMFIRKSGWEAYAAKMRERRAAS